MKAYNKEIPKVIIQNISYAKRYIYINVPWFTSQQLFAAIIMAAKRGVEVHLILEDDQINRSTQIEHSDLVKDNGCLYWHKKDVGLNHEKYCIIDDEVLIYGSFNWTYMASTHNIESILVSTIDEDGSELIEEFKAKFRLMTQSEDVVAERKVTVVKEEVVQFQGSSKALLDNTLELKARIYLLESECAFLEQQCQETSAFYISIQDKVRYHLTDLIIEKLRLQKELASMMAKKTRKKVYEEEVESKEKEIGFTNQWKSQTNQQEIEEATLPFDEEIRKLYHKAVRLAHPDKFQDDSEMYEKANEIMKKLNEAYKNRDLETIQKILFELENGLAFKNGVSNIQSQKTLIQIIDHLEQRKQELTKELEAFQADKIYLVFTKQLTIDEYIEERKLSLQKEIAALRQQIKDMTS
jgi:hypothetical protein